MLSPYDLGNLLIVENCEKLKVDDLIRKANKEIKIRLINAQIEVLGFPINLITTKTKFDGIRIWFACPSCKKRVGTLFKHPIEDKLGCRTCLNLTYKKQRFRGMIESNV